MSRPRIAEAIVVEGRYDRNTLLQAVDAVVVETDGFGVFSDDEKLEFIRDLARRCGIVLLTDSDSAGFLIRNHLLGKLGDGRVLQAYIPDVAGKERRKRVGGKDGLLGVEGMSPAVIIDALRRAGATFVDEQPTDAQAVTREDRLTRSDFVTAGLSGAPDSSERRAKLVKMLGLPARITPSALYRLLSARFTKTEFLGLISRL